MRVVTRLLATVVLAALAGIATERQSVAADVNAFQTHLLDLQFFTRPYERSANLGGAYMGAPPSAAAALQNPGALGFIKGADLLTYWTFDYTHGQGDGRNPRTRQSEKPISRISDVGAFGAFRLRELPGVVAMGFDAMGNYLSGNDLSRIAQDGQRLTLAYAVPLTPAFAAGYSLVYLKDHFQWGLTWEDGHTGVNTVNADSWLHRLGVQGRLGQVVRWGLQGELGFGRGNADWDNQITGGDDRLRERGLRGGLEWDISPMFTLAGDFEWRWQELNFGAYPAAIGASAQAEWRGDIYRPMLGLRQQIIPGLELLYGYRYNIFRADTLLEQDADMDYSTAALGADFRFLDIYHLNWSLEYSWLDPDGAIMSTLAAKASF